MTTRGYFPEAVYYNAAHDYVMSGYCNNLKEYFVYAKRHPEWEQDVAFAYFDKVIGFKYKYPKMKNMEK
jgi:hypothetical protein